MNINTNKLGKWIINNWQTVLMILMFFIILSLIMSTTCTKRKLNVAENNICALSDSLHVYELKNGELMYEKQGYILKKQELEKYIGIKEKEIKNLERQLGSAVAAISNLQAQIRLDSLQMTDSTHVVINDSSSSGVVYYNNFRYQDPWLTIDGTTIFHNNLFNTQINHINMTASLKVGMTKDNKWFATTDNPNLIFTSVEGANMQAAKPKRFSIGIQGGIGGLIGWGISGSHDGIVRTGWIAGGGFYLGLGITYKIYEF